LLQAPLRPQTSQRSAVNPAKALPAFRLQKRKTLMAAVTPSAVAWLICSTHWLTAHRYGICANTGAIQRLILIAQPGWLSYKGDDESG
jgi:hypothetical protein